MLDSKIHISLYESIIYFPLLKCRRNLWIYGIPCPSSITLHGKRDCADIIKFTYHLTLIQRVNRPALIIQISGSRGQSKEIRNAKQLGNAFADLERTNCHIVERSLGTEWQTASRNPSLSITSTWILPKARMSLEKNPKFHMKTEAMTNTLTSACCFLI